MQEVIDAYMARYRGRDPSLQARLAFWRSRIGDVHVKELDADRVELEMFHLAERGALKFVRGQGIVPKGQPLSPATLNRYLVALGSVLTFARRSRLLPRNHPSAIRGVEKPPEWRQLTNRAEATEQERSKQDRGSTDTHGDRPLRVVTPGTNIRPLPAPL